LLEKHLPTRHSATPTLEALAAPGAIPGVAYEDRDDGMPGDALR
jgi:hypothetical protein